MKYVVAASIAICLAIVVAPRAARAHSYPRSESPAAGATLDSSPARVLIRFDNPIEPLFAHLQVFDSSGAQVDKGNPQVGASGADLNVDLKPLAAGEYTVKWSVVAHDSHSTKGSFTFTVVSKAAQ